MASQQMVNSLLFIIAMIFIISFIYYRNNFTLPVSDDAQALEKAQKIIEADDMADFEPDAFVDPSAAPKGPKTNKTKEKAKLKKNRCPQSMEKIIPTVNGAMVAIDKEKDLAFNPVEPGALPSSNFYSQMMSFDAYTVILVLPLSSQRRRNISFRIPLRTFLHFCFFLVIFPLFRYALLQSILCISLDHQFSHDKAFFEFCRFEGAIERDFLVDWLGVKTHYEYDCTIIALPYGDYYKVFAFISLFCPAPQLF